jgi:DNA-binding NarL/FixJ family response regulator
VAIRILLVDDNAEFLRVAAGFLATDPAIEIAGLAPSGGEALKLTERLRPDLVLMDLAMPDMNGLAATRRIKARRDPPRVVILTLYDNAEYRVQAQCVGVDGYVAKSDFGEVLLPLIHALCGPNNREGTPTVDSNEREA